MSSIKKEVRPLLPCWLWWWWWCCWWWEESTVVLLRCFSATESVLGDEDSWSIMLTALNGFQRSHIMKEMEMEKDLSWRILIQNKKVKKQNETNLKIYIDITFNLMDTKNNSNNTHTHTHANTINCLLYIRINEDRVRARAQLVVILGPVLRSPHRKRAELSPAPAGNYKRRPHSPATRHLVLSVSMRKSRDNTAQMRLIEGNCAAKSTRNRVTATEVAAAAAAERWQGRGWDGVAASLICIYAGDFYTRYRSVMSIKGRRVRAVEVAKVA